MTRLFSYRIARLMLNFAAGRELVSPGNANAWRAELQAYPDSARFFFSLTLVLTTAIAI